MTTLITRMMATVTMIDPTTEPTMMNTHRVLSSMKIVYITASYSCTLQLVSLYIMHSLLIADLHYLQLDNLCAH